MKFPNLLLMIAVLVLSALGLAAQTTPASQQRMVNKAEIERLEAIAKAMLEKISYRKKTTQLEYREGEKTPSYTSKTTFEILRPNRLRQVVEVHRTGDAVADAGFGDYGSEYIEIGNKRYYKENDKPWKMSTNKMDPNGPDISDPVLSSDERREYKYVYLGKQDLNGSVIDTYQVTTKIIIRNEILASTVRQVWFDRKGRFAKIQSDYTNNILKSLAQKITEYEYDVPIKIEAPIK